MSPQGEEPWRATDMAAAVDTFRVCFLDALQQASQLSTRLVVSRRALLAGCGRPAVQTCLMFGLKCADGTRGRRQKPSQRKLVWPPAVQEVKAGLAEKARAAAAQPTLAW